jgi:hypothetical protein
MTQQFDQLLDTQDMLMRIWVAIGYTSPSDIPDEVKRKRIYEVWEEIGEYLEKEGISLVF